MPAEKPRQLVKAQLLVCVCVCVDVCLLLFGAHKTHVSNLR